jgi:DNA polymerase (family 10)
MDNSAIADRFSLLARLMDIHGENSFKAKSYASAAFQIDQLKQPLAGMDGQRRAELPGIGTSTAAKIEEILQTGSLKALDEILAKTPPGILEMMAVKGLGPKKIATIWKEMGVESIGELLYACQENRLMRTKGFGARTQENVQEAIEFMLRHRDKSLYADAEAFATGLAAQLQADWPSGRHALSGDVRRQCPVLDGVDIVTTLTLPELAAYLTKAGLSVEPDPENTCLRARAEGQIPAIFHSCTPQTFGNTLFRTTASHDFREAWTSAYGELPPSPIEDDIFQAAGLPQIPPCLRESATILPAAAARRMPALISTEDIRGVIHTHSDWSDGAHTVREMAQACRDAGYEYLVVSDHSRSAQYAGGLDVEQVRRQHDQIDSLNAQLAGFRIFKGIECDILGDGSLDYPDEVLATFDMVIASVHANLRMSQEKAMQRLLKAIANPYTDVLGHPTGRLLLSRPGYPVDHLQLLDACAKAGVAVEINAHPRRLDLDWTWIPEALSRNLMLSIDPDAHSIDGIRDIRYGVMAAQKGGLTRQANLSSLSRAELEAWLRQRRSAHQPG